MARCALCNNFGPTKLKYDLDSAREHANTHFLQSNIVDDQVSADKIFTECFQVYKPAAARPNKRAKSSSRQILLDLCHSLFRREHTTNSSHFACAKCGVELTIRKGKCLDTTAIINHACSHLDEKELYACRHCSRQYKSSVSVRNHLTKVHRIRSTDGHFEDKSHNFVKEISAQIKSCFGQSAKSGDFDRNWARTALYIRARHKGSALSVKRHLLCHQLIRKIAEIRKIAGLSIQCRLCSSRLSVKRREGFSSHNAMDHVLLHLQKPTLRCRICSEVFVSRFTLMEHLRKVHALPVAKNHECVADEYHGEIMDLLKKCYRTNGDGNAIGDIIAPRSELWIRQHTNGSQLAIERTLLCHRLLRKFVNPERQLQCRLCSNWINAKNTDDSLQTRPVMQHALLHLAKPLFKCKQCTEPYSCSGSMKQHLRTKHALPFGNNYVCHQDEYHSEILDILRKCYGDERDGVKTE